MEFEKALTQASEYLSFTPRFINPAEPQGLWFCDSLVTASDIGVNAVCLGTGSSWDDVPRCRPFLEAFPFIVIVSPNAIARDEMHEALLPRLPAMCLYEIGDAGFRGCKTITEYISVYGRKELLSILSGAEELPAYGLLNLARVPKQNLLTIPRTLSGFPRLDKGILGFLEGRLSIWTGKRGIGKSTLVSQMLLESLNQGHVVCAYSGELPKEQFREWMYLQAAGPEHIAYQTDLPTGKRVAVANALADKQISDWMDERYWLYDLDRNTRHDPEMILSQFEYARMRYGADTFLVDNMMSVDLATARDRDYYRAQADFVQQLSTFAKRRHVNVHLVVHPRKSSGKSGAVDNDDISGSGDITNKADNVFFLTRHNRVVDGKSVEAPLLVILKNRDFGTRGDVWLDFDGKSRRFFQYKAGSANKRYAWDPAGQQLTLNELTDPAGAAEIDRIFPPEQEASPCK